MIRGIHHIAMHTPNFDRMVRFYGEAFGFKPLTDEFGWRDSPFVDGGIDLPGSAARGLMLKAGNCFLEMFEYSSPPPREAGAARPNDHGYTHFCVDVTDIAAEMERLAGLGMTFPLAAPRDDGLVKFIYGKDPDGNIIELIELAKDYVHAMEQLERVDMTPAA
jgi:catechol 2,3-dioxygenase-like lactoylglutathione lyase family enzyme